MKPPISSGATMIAAAISAKRRPPRPPGCVSDQAEHISASAIPSAASPIPRRRVWFDTHDSLPDRWLAGEPAATAAAAPTTAATAATAAPAATATAAAREEVGGGVEHAGERIAGVLGAAGRPLARILGRWPVPGRSAA